VTEAVALRVFDGRGAVRLLEADLDRYCTLLERLEPGTSLLSVQDDERATAIAAAAMRQLWRQPPESHPFFTLERWSRDLFTLRDYFGGTTGPFPEWMIDRAQSVFRELMASSDEPVVLHGDLHHDNVLAARRQPWLAIDPKGLVGEPCYETGSWLRNWLPDLLAQPDPRSILARRIDQFADELGFDRARIRDWAFAQAVLSQVWVSEGDDTPDLRVAEILSTIL
jgi:streptomycin 6-kinase